MENNGLHLLVQEMRQSFFDEGYLDSQYVQIEALSTDTTPHFIVEVITLYFRDSPNVIATLEQELERDPMEITNITRCILRLTSSTASIGAAKVLREINKAKTFLEANNKEALKSAVSDIKKEHSELRTKFETYFQMMRQAGPTEVAVNSC